MTQVRLAVDIHANLGEGLHWDPVQEVLWMVDIHGRRLLQWRLDSTDWREWTLQQRIGWIIPRANSTELSLGLQQGIALADEDNLSDLHWLARTFEGRQHLRLNDAKADKTGAVWAGNLNNEDESRSDGCLFRFSPDGKFETVATDYCVANGPAIHPSERLMLHTDSARGTIYTFDLDVAAGRLSNRRIWKRFAAENGFPDGLTFDADGCVWVAHWGAAKVTRVSADREVLRSIGLPVSNVTNVCFAGPDLSRLLVTAARAVLTAATLAGALFEVDAGSARGIAPQVFR